MSATTGPILATGLVVLANKSVFNNEGFDWRVLAATGIAAGMFNLLEKPLPDAAKGISYIALATVLLVRINNKPSPVENFLKWWDK